MYQLNDSGTVLEELVDELMWTEKQVEEKQKKIEELESQLMAARDSALVVKRLERENAELQHMVLVARKELLRCHKPGTTPRLEQEITQWQSLWQQVVAKTDELCTVMDRIDREDQQTNATPL